MNKFEIKIDNNKTSSINRTIRISSEMFDKINKLSEKSGVSFNKIILQCISFALDHMEEE